MKKNNFLRLVTATAFSFSLINVNAQDINSFIETTEHSGNLIYIRPKPNALGAGKSIQISGGLSSIGQGSGNVTLSAGNTYVKLIEGKSVGLSINMSRPRSFELTNSGFSFNGVADDDTRSVKIGLNKQSAISFIPADWKGSWFHIHNTNDAAQSALQISHGNLPGEAPLMTFFNSGLTKVEKGLMVGHGLNLQGHDLQLGTSNHPDRPVLAKPHQRALVHWGSDRLIINFDGDFEGGTFVENKLTIGAVGTATMAGIRDKFQQAHNDAMLAVEGKIAAKSIVVSASIWADYVFEKNYKLKPLSEVESFIKENKHLPEVPSEKEVMENGISLGEMDAVLLKKIEELTLYMIEMKKENEKLTKEVEVLKKKLN